LEEIVTLKKIKNQIFFI